MKKLFASRSDADAADLVGSVEQTMMCMTIDEVKKELEKNVLSMQVMDTRLTTSEEEDNDISFNYDVIGKDTPRLVGKTYVNGQKMSNVSHFIVSLIDLILNRGMPIEDEKNIYGVNVHSYYQNLYAQMTAKIKKENIVMEDHVSLTSFLKALFMVGNPVFQLLRCYNQNAISQPVTYYKLILGTVHKLNFQDKDWTVCWDVVDHDMYGKKRTITVKHVRTEKHVVDRQEKFSFSWNISFEYEQIVKTVEEYNRSPVSNLDLISQKTYTPVKLNQVVMSFGKLEEWAENVKDERFPTKENAIAFLEYIFETTVIKFN
ncbi:hypothetical protein C9374_005065 [Naegleria lovaniensis]|uniref:Ras guanine nucleotide exchange factor glfB-like C-terminal domain-containing protein n=1 Tax=Naegleria lovaniensis TaxID=51637 RepID=A0AA88GQZ7_NAELO|nr:uncharacterized protein C9374_005065 [Naegleria lovaniensis]KAG2382485.1 hypothetical protein C9374_005065 [Naegleria lovaniensis]